ncbi:MAG: DNA repair protein RadA [bacterium]
MSKKGTVYVCSECGYESVRWLGQCPDCKAWSTLEESDISVRQLSTSSESIKVRQLSHIEKSELKRLDSGFAEFNRVLGGGLVEGSAVLISGEPGIGKSTLLLQLIRNISNSKKALYVSAEESIEQIALRGVRLFGEKLPEINLASAFAVEKVLDLIAQEKYQFVILDSIQTFYSLESKGLPGGFSQVKSVASKLVSFAKQYGVTMILVGQITKEGSIAGPKLLEHLVDVVLELEGKNEYGFRMLRSLKNRFGSINEVGLFEMTDVGMSEISDPMVYFKDDVMEPRVGVCFTAVNEGNRIILLEVQALTVATTYSLPKRVAEGIAKSRLELISAIISKYVNSQIKDKDIYIKIAGGIKVQDQGVDLAVCLAILSSLSKKALPAKTVAFGEISLAGKIRTGISRLADREREIERLGYTSFAKSYKQITELAQLKSVV